MRIPFAALAIMFALTAACGRASEQERLARPQNQASDAIETAAAEASSDRAKDREAQASLRNTLTSAKAIYTENKSYSGVTLSKLARFEPSLTFVEDVSTGPKVVAIDVVSPQVFVAAAMSETNTCFAIRSEEAMGGGLSYAQRSGRSCRTALFTKDDFSPMGWV